MLYQEQVMQVAQRFAGFSLGKADILRIIGTAVNPLKDSYAVGSALVYGNIDDFGPNFIPGLIYEVIKIVSMYFTIHYISKYKLNLQ